MGVRWKMFFNYVVNLIKKTTTLLFNAGLLCVTVTDLKLRTAVELRNISLLPTDRNCTSIHAMPLFFLFPPSSP